MANYSQLKAAIADAIKTNGTKAITGQVLQDVLNSMVSVIGANYTFAGVATPSTNPSTPDQNVVYFASQAGTYTNFGAVVLPAGIHLLMWNGSWSTQTFFAIDDTPSAGSNNLVKSGGVYKFKANFVENEPYVLELYLNSDGVTQDVANLHMIYASSGLIRFSNTAKNAFTGLARATPNTISCVPITNVAETQVLGYIVIDLTGISSDVNVVNAIKIEARKIEASPYIYASKFLANKEDVGFKQGCFFNGYINLNTSTHVGTIKKNKASDQYALMIMDSTGAYKVTSFADGDTFELPDINNFYVAYKISTGTMVVQNTLPDNIDYIIFGYYMLGNVTLNMGVIKVNGIENTITTKYLKDEVELFAENCPFVKELYINPLGIAADVGMLHSVNSSGTVCFAKTDGSAYSGRARGGEFGKINLLPIKAFPNETGAIWGYILIDLTNINGEQNFLAKIKEPAKDIAYSPYINTKYGVDTLEVGAAVGETLYDYDTIITLADDGSGDYTTFASAHNACVAEAGKVLLQIKTGVYYINPSDYSGNGPQVTYDILGLGDVTLKTIYTGDDTSIRQNFSPINTTNTPQQHQTVRFENIKIIVQGVRYCVHDEFGHLTTPSYTHIFKNCKFKHLSAPDSVWESPRCIGGGLGNKGLILIEDCEFESVIENSVDYHTGFDGGAQSSKVIIKNCLLAKNTVSCTSTTYASDLSLVVVQDCILNAQPYYTDNNNHKDMKLITRNNIIV